MKEIERAAQTKKTLSITQELRQVFADWVDKLPFIKREIPKDAGRADTEDKPADQAESPGPSDDRLAEPSLDHEGKAR